jgi:hypothetical protein
MFTQKRALLFLTVTVLDLLAYALVSAKKTEGDSFVYQA